MNTKGDKLASRLLGTGDPVDVAWQELFGEPAPDDALMALDGAFPEIELCEGCGWWVEVGEMVYNEDDDTTRCNDCSSQ